MKQTFKYNFGEQTVEFDVLRLGELKALDAHISSVQEKAQAGSRRALAPIEALIPILANAAQRINKEVTQERLEQLLDMYNFTEVFQGVLFNSYGGGSKAEGEAKPVQ